MLFNSGIFAVFFVLFFPLYLLLRRNVFWRNALLIISSYVFYGWWDPRFLILVAVSTSTDYIAALGAAGKPVSTIDKIKSAAYLATVTCGALCFASRADLWLVPLVLGGIVVFWLFVSLIERAPADRRRKYWVTLSLATNLGILGFFKYFNFFENSLAAVLSTLGVELHTVALSIILPVGLSFYTFQAISRTVDCYRGKFEPAYSIINYGAYHAFFPQLVAGPIERAAHLMPQFEMVRALNWRMFMSGALLFLWGLYQKMVIADNVAPLANSVFGHSAGQTAAATLVAVLAFTFQIYCDFCGYSNMARGLARCLGFDLMVNFNLPYFARTPSEFWQRWHISLSSWLRDYLYISLGGNRRGSLIMYRNLMITMLLGGLWHGAGWTFVAWGAFHGAIQIAFRLLKVDTLIERTNIASLRGVLVHTSSWAATTILVIAGWVFFRAPNFADATTIFSNLAGLSGYSIDVFLPLLHYVGPLILVEIYQRRANQLEVLNVGPFLVRYTAAMSVLLTVLLLGAPAGQQFIYFDF